MIARWEYNAIAHHYQQPFPITGSKISLEKMQGGDDHLKSLHLFPITG